MKSRGKDKKKGGKNSDEEDNAEEEIDLGDESKGKPEPTAVEKQQIELADMPTIPDSEISPAAYIFQQQEDKDDLGIYEEK